MAYSVPFFVLWTAMRYGMIIFLRQRPLGGGARIFRVGPDEAAVRNAIKFSKVRKELYEQGIYAPSNYLMVWARDDLLRWAREMRQQGLDLDS